MSAIRVRRLTATDREMARAVFRTMADVFSEPSEPLRDAYLDRLLERPDFWAFAALFGDDIIGGITAHAIPMTRADATELFIYDIAVRPEFQRQGVGRSLVAALRDAAVQDGIHVAFVPADNEDVRALDFYRALGGEEAPVTFFTFSTQED